mgnify:CR=1 FL=1
MTAQELNAETSTRKATFQDVLMEQVRNRGPVTQYVELQTNMLTKIFYWLTR